jgi:hypothetical protein
MPAPQPWYYTHLVQQSIQLNSALNAKAQRHTDAMTATSFAERNLYPFSEEPGEGQNDDQASSSGAIFRRHRRARRTRRSGDSTNAEDFGEQV